MSPANVMTAKAHACWSTELVAEGGKVNNLQVVRGEKVLMVSQLCLLIGPRDIHSTISLRDKEINTFAFRTRNFIEIIFESKRANTFSPHM
jgi:hypothetical protein